MSAPQRVADPSTLPVLTVLVHPDDDPADPQALRVLRSTRPVDPWVPFTGRTIQQQSPRMHNGVVGWRVQTIGEITAALNGEVR